jgi:phytoene dehydrogenase-like protein
MKIIIIGGGIAGLSAAHLLSKYPDFDITIIESDNQIGGQAKSKFGKYCYTEYAWRVFGTSYHNLNKIINEIGADKNFAEIKYSCINSKNKTYYDGLSRLEIIKTLVNNKEYGTINKLAELTTISRERAINEYDNVNANNYFKNNDVMKSIIGPYLGLEANKTSLSGYYKNLLSVSDRRKFPFTPDKTRVSKFPTSESLFNVWKDYLINKGVKILTSTCIIKVDISNNKIINIIC